MNATEHDAVDGEAAAAAGDGDKSRQRLLLPSGGSMGGLGGADDLDMVVVTMTDALTPVICLESIVVTANADGGIHA